jgi:hypothetical protein
LNNGFNAALKFAFENCALKHPENRSSLLLLESKSSKKRRKVAPRSRAIFLAAALLGAVAFAAVKIDSVAADNARASTSNAGKNAESNRDTAAGSAALQPDQPDKPTGDAVGTIEGDAIALQGPMSVEVVNGQVKTMLRSGNDIRVKSGQAQIDLVEGGKIAICGPAHLSLLKSGGSLTIALDNGVIHVYVERAPSVVVYTPQIQAKPIAIGDGAEDALIGFDSTGVMCVRAETGAIRLEHQLSGQSVIVPQGGDILLNSSGLESISNTGGHCECEIQIAKVTVPAPEVSRIATPEEIRQRDAAKTAEAAAIQEAADNAAMDKAAAEKEAADKAAAARAAAERAAADKLAADQATTQQASAAQQAAAQQAAAQQAAAQQSAAQQAAAARAAAANAAANTSAANTAKPPVPWGESTAPPVENKVKIEAPKGQEPVYQVFMPPLSFDAKAAAPADNFDPKFIMLVRRVRVKPTLIFKGTVEGETPVAKQVSDVRPVSTTAKVGPVQPPNGAKPQGEQSNAKPAQSANDSVVNRVRNYLRHLFS